MIRVVVGGATGKLGRLVCDMIRSSDDMELVGAVVSPDGKNVGKELYPGVFGTVPADISKTLADADVYVDLTTPQAAAELIAEIPNNNVNIVLGTTAVPAEVIKKMEKNVASRKTSAVISANFATGVNVFWSIAEKMAEMLKGYQIELTEVHHAGKKDSPSGTTLETVKRIQSVTGIDDVIYGRSGVSNGRGDEICVHSIRLGDAVGEHTVLFAGNKEVLELRHNAISRDTLASGCLTCIRWIHNKKDGKIHGMREVLGI